MTSEQAIERVTKLREITVERGATLHEAATACALAARLSERFALERPTAMRHGVARYAASTSVDRRSPRSLRMVAFA